MLGLDEWRFMSHEASLSSTAAADEHMQAWCLPISSTSGHVSSAELACDEEFCLDVGFLPVAHVSGHKQTLARSVTGVRCQVAKLTLGGVFDSHCWRLRKVSNITTRVCGLHPGQVDVPLKNHPRGQSGNARRRLAVMCSATPWIAKKCPSSL